MERLIVTDSGRLFLYSFYNIIATFHAFNIFRDYFTNVEFKKEFRLVFSKFFSK